MRVPPLTTSRFSMKTKQHTSLFGSGTVAKGIWHLCLIGGAGSLSSDKFDAFRFQRTLTNLTAVVRQGRKKPLDTKLVHSGQPQVSTTNSKCPWSSPCCSSTPQPVSSMCVEVEQIHTQTVSTVPSHQYCSKGCGGPDCTRYDLFSLGQRS